jgi:hypothetical protein
MEDQRGAPGLTSAMFRSGGEGPQISEIVTVLNPYAQIS